MCVCRNPNILLPHDFLQFFNAILFDKNLLRIKIFSFTQSWCATFNTVLQLFSLGKLTIVFEKLNRTLIN